MPTQTFPARPEDRRWFVVDAQEYTLGRLASRVASVLRGKHKPIFSPHLDHGDHVVVINADKIQLTGRKMEQKSYFRHTGYPGGGRTTMVGELLAKAPDEVIRRAVKGMLPKNRLGRQMIKKMKVYAGPEHPHAAQGPVPLPRSNKASLQGEA